MTARVACRTRSSTRSTTRPIGVARARAHTRPEIETSTSRVTALSLFGLFGLVGCGADAGAPGGWAGTIDTLANGVVVVHNPSTPSWNEASAWRLVEELRIGTADTPGPELFGRIADLAVDDYGRIYVLESQAKELRVFGPDGTHIRTIGRQGSGPGEFERPIGMAWDAEGKLWVVDGMNARYAAFDTTGSYVAGMPRPLSGTMSPWPGAFDGSGRLIDFAFTGMTGVLVRLDPTFEPTDTFWLPIFDGQFYDITAPDGRGILRAPVPFTPRLVWRFDPRGYLWFGTRAPYRIVQRMLTGDTVRIIERDYQPVRVSPEDRAAAIARVEEVVQGATVDLSRIPQERTAYQQIFVSTDGHLWVAPDTADEAQGRLFDVFDPDGRYLGRVRSDVRLALYPDPMILNDLIYAVAMAQQGVPYVVRMRIVRGSNVR